MFEIRPATIADADFLTDLAFRSKASNGYDRDFMEACREELTYGVDDISAYEFWVCENDEGRMLGFCGLVVEGGSMEIDPIFVEPDLKRSGVGRFLWGHIEERARDLNVRVIGLDADPFAEPFYLSMGLNVVGRSPSGSIEGRTLARMEKRL